MSVDSQVNQPLVKDPLLADPLNEEQRHLDEVLSHIDRMLSRLQSLPKYFNEDSSEPQTADEVAQQAVEKMRDEQIHSLVRMKSEPYFGRLDFQEKGETSPTALYIGKRGMENDVTGDRLIIDWRAPVASMFYSFSGGSETASYESPEGTVEGEVFLKRNIVVRNQVLQRVVDSYVKGQDNLHVTDEFLLYRLSEHKDNRLRDIVSTIQAEQDKIIRAERDKAIVIQGVAGSGKTTVALHRLAYLLYQHKDKMRAERMVIFAPNAMFVDYISEVLPELGVGGIQQTTFPQWALQMLDQSVKLRDPGRRLSKWFGVTKDPRLSQELQASQYKGSPEFLRHIDAHLERVEQTLVPDSDFEPWEGLVLSVESIRKWFNEDYRHYPLRQRKERTLARVKRWYETEYQRIKADDKNGTKKKLAMSRFRSYQAKWPNLSPIELYYQILWDSPIGHVVQGGKPGTAALKSKRPEVEVEDLAPLMYIYTWLNGVDGRERFDHVVIDEAQDFSPAHIAVLKAYCPSRSFTILGDLSQSIHTYQGITSWNSFLELFDEGESLYFQLDVSYRSTMEIIEYANDIIRPFEGFTLAKPVFRSGEPVKVTKVTERDRFKQAVEAVQSFMGEADTVALVTRTDEEAQRYHQVLAQAGIQANLIDSKQQEYLGGISVVPVYLTKGLEFDAVLMVDVNRENYDDSPLSAKLLYVGCTRALHKLWIQYSGEASPLIGADESSGTRRAG
jgi:DNA helicase-2/ATP-dependent DNA helicase PcrA